MGAGGAYFSTALQSRQSPRQTSADRGSDLTGIDYALDNDGGYFLVVID